jgi:hypothetical protein
MLFNRKLLMQHAFSKESWQHFWAINGRNDIYVQSELKKDIWENKSHKIIAIDRIKILVPLFFMKLLFLFQLRLIELSWL